jgi:hypothetical protein
MIEVLFTHTENGAIINVLKALENRIKKKRLLKDDIEKHSRILKVT